MECLGLHNKPKAEVRLGHKLTGPKEEEEEEEDLGLRPRGQWDRLTQTIQGEMLRRLIKNKIEMS
jgi:hypothetical protein